MLLLCFYSISTANRLPYFVNITEVNQDSSRPGLDEEERLLVKVGQSYSYRITADDDDYDDVISIKLIQAPPGMTIDESKTSIHLYPSTYPSSYPSIRLSICHHNRRSLYLWRDRTCAIMV